MNLHIAAGQADGDFVAQQAGQLAGHSPHASHAQSPQPSPTSGPASGGRGGQRSLSVEPQVATATRGANGQEMVRLWCFG